MRIDLPVIIIIGPTAIGKTELSLQVAARFSGEIISVDSMQVYRYMDIGTAKPTAAQQARIPHHLIDIVDPDEDYTVASFIADTEKAIELIVGRDSTVMLVGGTGLYLRGLLAGVFAEDRVGTAAKAERDSIRAELKRRLREEGRRKLHAELAEADPVSAARIHPNDTQRLLRALEIYQQSGMPWSEHLAGQRQNEALLQFPGRKPLKLGLTCDRDVLYQRINKRVEIMLAQGLLNEVEMLLAKGYDQSLKPMQAIGYRHMVNYLNGNCDWDRAVALLARDTRHYAKRQYTWFNRDPEINWYHPGQHEEIMERVALYLKQ